LSLFSSHHHTPAPAAVRRCQGQCCVFWRTQQTPPNIFSSSLKNTTPRSSIESASNVSPFPLSLLSFAHVPLLPDPACSPLCPAQPSLRIHSITNVVGGTCVILSLTRLSTTDTPPLLMRSGLGLFSLSSFTFALTLHCFSLRISIARVPIVVYGNGLEMAGRVGHSIMTTLGISELIAQVPSPNPLLLCSVSISHLCLSVSLKRTLFPLPRVLAMNLLSFALFAPNSSTQRTKPTLRTLSGISNRKLLLPPPPSCFSHRKLLILCSCCCCCCLPLLLQLCQESRERLRRDLELFHSWQEAQELSCHL
jgi:hypothetical protein